MAGDTALKPSARTGYGPDHGTYSRTYSRMHSRMYNKAYGSVYSRIHNRCLVPAATLLLASLFVPLLLSIAYCSDDLSTVNLSKEEVTGLYMGSIRSSHADLSEFFQRMPKGGAVYNHISGSDYAYEVNITEPQASCFNASISLATGLGRRSIRPELINYSLAIAILRQRAAEENFQYIEAVIDMPAQEDARGISKTLVWDGNVTRAYGQIVDEGLGEAARNASEDIELFHNLSECLLRCNSSKPDPGCNVAIRYQANASREGCLNQTFARIALAFDVALRSPLVVGVRLDAMESRKGVSGAGSDLSEQMRMEKFLQGVYLEVATEIETDPAGSSLLDSKWMGPLSAYVIRGNVANASDHAEVLKTDLSEQLAFFAFSHKEANYSEFKRFVRDSLEYSFLPGESLWAIPGNYTKIASGCAFDSPGPEMPSPECLFCIEASDKARAQWKLEGKLAAFEDEMSRRHLRVKGEVDIVPEDVKGHKDTRIDLHKSCSVCG